MPEAGPRLPSEEEDPDGLLARARDAFWDERYEEALRDLEKALALDPAFVRGQAAKVITLCQLGRASDGLAAAEAALAFHPGTAVLYSALAFCRARLGDREGARKAFEKSLTLAPDDGVIYYNYASHLAELGDGEGCRRLLVLALERDPKLITWAAKDPDFARLASQDWFRDLLAEYKRRLLRRR